MRLLFLLSALVALALAGDWQKRKFTFDPKDNELNIKAQLSTKTDDKENDKEPKKGSWESYIPEVPVFGKTQDKLEWRMQTTSSGLKIFLKWMSKTEDLKEKMKFNTYLKSVIEYDCRDCDGSCCAYDKNLDTAVVVRNSLDNWKKINYVGCEGEGEELPCTATFETQDGSFSVKAEINIAGLSEGDLNLSNNDLKLTVTENFPLTSTNPSAIAILGHAESKSKTKSRTKSTAEGDEQEDAITNDESESVTATFSWLNDVTCNGATRAVLPGVKDGAAEDADTESAKTISWSILKTSGDGACVWDPVVEFNDGRFCFECYALYFAAAFLLLCVVGCCCWCCRKKNTDKDHGMTSAPSRMNGIELR